MVGPTLIVDGLRKSFNGNTAVETISFEIFPNETVGLLGGNGAGKTTSIGMICGLIAPTAGTIRVFGRDLARHRAEIAAGMNFSSPYVEMPYRLTIRQNLLVFGRLYGVPSLRRRIEELAAALQLTELLDRPFGKLSAGQRTRAGLAKSLLNRPKLLLLDEPTASLDPDTADWLRGYLQAYRRETGAAFLLASHNMAEVERLCDRVLMMRRGRVVDQGPPSDLIARYGRRTMEEVFLDIARAQADETAA